MCCRKLNTKTAVGLILLMMTVLLAGCAGRRPDPVPVYLPGDENRDCESLKKEIVDIQKKMHPLLPNTDKTFANTLWSVGGTVAGNVAVAGGAVGVVPYLFIDMKDAERIEYEAFRRRHNRLLLIIQSKSCDTGDIRAEPIPSLAERKLLEKEVKKSKTNKEDSSK
ncbi:MAG: hypothetical protein ABII09_08760 [Planctomycetota bacterium]